MLHLVDKPVIGFDLDGVILDHTANKIALAKKFGVVLVAAQTPSPVFKLHVPEDILSHVQNTLYADPDSIRQAPVMPGLVTFLERLQSAKIPVVLISRRQNSQYAIEALQHHQLWPRFFAEHNAFFVSDKAAKNTKSIELGVTHYIDDEISVLAHLTDVPYRFLFDHLDVSPDADDYHRVRSWDELTKNIFNV